MLNRHRPVRPQRRNRTRNPRRDQSELFRSQSFNRHRPQQQTIILGVIKGSLTIPDMGNHPTTILGMGNQRRTMVGTAKQLITTLRLVKQTVTTSDVGKQPATMATITRTPCAVTGMNG